MRDAKGVLSILPSVASHLTLYPLRTLTHCTDVLADICLLPFFRTKSFVTLFSLQSFFLEYFLDELIPPVQISISVGQYKADMLSAKNSPSGLCVLATALCACLIPQASAANLLEDVVPYYGPASKSSVFPYSAFIPFSSSAAPPSASVYAYSTAATPNPYPYTVSVSASAAPSGVPYPIGSAPGSSWMPYNSTVAYPTGGWTHKVTPTSHHETVPLVTQTSIATVPAPSAPATPSPVVGEQPNGAASVATNFAGIIVAAGIAMFAL